MKIVLGLYFLFCIVDVIVSIDYTCDSQAECGCSKRSTISVPRIIGGQPVNILDSWGWMGSLRLDNIHKCGASLITPWYVITAAHCVLDIDPISRLSVNFGIIDLRTIGQIRNITKISIHPLFKRKPLVNDIALLRLNKPINLTNSNISAICLPTPSEFNLDQAEYPPVGEFVVAIGWGLTTPFAVLPSDVLRQVTIQVMDRREPSCTRMINNNTVQFCAGYAAGRKDTCKGDSGGPLMLFKNGRWQLVGITSYGGVCGSPGFAGIYTRVAYYYSYIQEILTSNGISTEYRKEINSMINSKQRSSNTETFYRKSSMKFICIFVYLVYKIFVF